MYVCAACERPVISNVRSLWIPWNWHYDRFEPHGGLWESRSSVRLTNANTLTTQPPLQPRLGGKGLEGRDEGGGKGTDNTRVQVPMETRIKCCFLSCELPDVGAETQAQAAKSIKNCETTSQPQISFAICLSMNEIVSCHPS